MKKIIVMVLGLFVCAAGLSAQNISFSVVGPEKLYNQLRLVNYTKKTSFDCQANFLVNRDGKLSVAKKLGGFHLEGYGDTDSKTVLKFIKRGDIIGLTLPSDMKKIAYEVYYEDLGPFDIIEVYLYDQGSPKPDFSSSRDESEANGEK